MARSTIKYLTDDDQVLQVQLDNAKVALAGDAPTGAITQTNVLVSPNAPKRRRNVLTARAWIYSYSEPTEGGLFAYKRLRVIKVTPAAFNAAKVDTVTYKGTVYKFVKKDPEG